MSELLTMSLVAEEKLIGSSMSSRTPFGLNRLMLMLLIVTLPLPFVSLALAIAIFLLAFTRIIFCFGAVLFLCFGATGAFLSSLTWMIAVSSLFRFSNAFG